MRGSRTLIALIACLTLVATACGGGTENLLSQGADSAQTDGDGDSGEDSAAPTTEPTEAPEATLEPTSEPEPTPTAAPTPTPEPEPTPTPDAPATIIAVFGDGTIDFDVTEDNLIAQYGNGGGSLDAANTWFETRGVIPSQVADIHRETLSALDPEAQDILIPFMQVVTTVACEAGALGWNDSQFTQQYVDWNLATQEGDPEELRIIAGAVGTGAITAADSICPADSPSFASGNPQLPAAPNTDSDTTVPLDGPLPQGDDFLAAAADLAGCSLAPTDTGESAALDYQFGMTALGFIESFDDAIYLPETATNCAVAEDTALKFWGYASGDDAVLSAEPILLAPPSTDGPCWAITGYFDFLILGLSAPGVSPSAVDNVNALAPLDADLVTSGGSCP